VGLIHPAERTKETMSTKLAEQLRIPALVDIIDLPGADAVCAEEESWRPYGDGYEVSDRGRVRSYRSTRRGVSLEASPRVLDGHTQQTGYRIVLIWVDGKKRIRLIHRMVLEAFVGPCPEGMECRHLDGDRANNTLTNLCWGTHTENIRDRGRHGTAGRRR
jgi:hypothetical protein